MNEVNTNTSRYALVTGASRGIGRAIALKLAKQGFVVIINYASNVEAAQKTLDDITAEGGKAELLPFDVSSCEAVATALAEWKANHPNDYMHRVYAQVIIQTIFGNYLPY